MMLCIILRVFRTLHTQHIHLGSDARSEKMKSDMMQKKVNRLFTFVIPPNA